MNYHGDSIPPPLITYRISWPTSTKPGGN